MPQLARIVQAALTDVERWAPLVRFDPRQRSWAVLHAGADVDIWLLTWLGTQATELHDHGGSAGAFTVVTGRLEEVRVTSSGTLRVREIRSGQVAEVAPGMVHDVRNPFLEPAISIHAYSPPLSRMTYYERGPGGIVPVRTVETRQPEGASA